MALDSPEDHPLPAIRLNLSGRITNLDDIRDHLGKYGWEELEIISVKVGQNLIKAQKDLEDFRTIFKNHENQATGILKRITDMLEINSEGKLSHLGNTEEIISKYQKIVSDLLAESTVQKLTINGQKMYVLDLLLLEEELSEQIKIRNN